MVCTKSVKEEVFLQPLCCWELLSLRGGCENLLQAGVVTGTHSSWALCKEKEFAQLIKVPQSPVCVGIRLIAITQFASQMSREGK